MKATSPRTLHWRSLTLLPLWLLALLFLPQQSAWSQAPQLPDFTQLVKHVSPTVVNISTVQHSGPSQPSLQMEIPGLPPELNEFFRRYLEKQSPPGGRQGDPHHPPEHDAESLGAGFIISPDGYILTNHHVVADADQIIVRLNDRRELEARVIGSDKRSDIALIKIDADNLPIVRIGSSASLQVGEWVLAIGAPFGFERSATAGIVSALGRSLPSGNYVPFIQTDVAINPGNSGGPLFNLKGEVVGINSQIYSRSGGYMGLSFAVPIDVAMETVKQLRDHGHVTRGYLGVLIQDVNRDLAESFGMDKPEGALVSQVLADGPADLAGIQVGDIILHFNNETVINAAALPPKVGRTGVGSDSKVEVIRNGKTVVLQVKLGELPEEPGFASAAGTAQSERNRLGLAVSPLSDEQREASEVSEGGVLITRLTPDGAASRAGAQTGDVILMLNGKRISTVQQYHRLVKQLPASKAVPMLVQRSGSPLFLPVRVPE